MIACLGLTCNAVENATLRVNNSWCPRFAQEIARILAILVTVAAFRWHYYLQIQSETKAQAVRKETNFKAETHVGQSESIQAESRSELQHESDADLLTRYVETGQVEHFEEIVRRYYGLVISVSHRQLWNHHDASDAAQITFAVLLHSIRKLRSKTSLSSWLYGVAYRTSLRIRQKTLKINRATESADLESLIDSNVTPFDDLEKKMQLDVLDEELQNVRESYRRLLIEHYLMGKPAKQIANEQGLSLSTVEGRLRRGRSELKKRLSRHGLLVPTIAQLSELEHWQLSREHSYPQFVGRVLRRLDTENLKYITTLIGQDPQMPSIILSKIGLGAIVFAVFSCLAAVSVLLQTYGFSQSVESSREVASGVSADAVEQAVSKRALPNTSATNTGAVAASEFLPSDYRVRATLMRTAEDIEYNGQPLSLVLQLLSDQLNVGVWLDTQEVDEIGLDVETPVTLSLPPTPMGEVLALVLTPLDLSYRIRNGIIHVGPKEKLDRKPTMRVYDLSIFSKAIDVASIGKALEENLRTLEPQLWENNTWNATVVDQKMIVNASDPAHFEFSSRIGDLAVQLGLAKPLENGLSANRVRQPPSVDSDSGQPLNDPFSADPFSADPVNTDPFAADTASEDPFGGAAPIGPLAEDPFAGSATDNDPFQ